MDTFLSQLTMLYFFLESISEINEFTLYFDRLNSKGY